MKTLIRILALFVLALVPEAGAQSIFSNAGDIGRPALKGAMTYDTATQTYTIQGGGYNIWFNRDEFHYASSKISGDFVLTADFRFPRQGKDPHRKTGWMIRASAEEDAAHASAVLHGDGLTVLQWRSIKGAFMRDPQDEVFAPKKNYSTLQLERKGKVLIMRAAHRGEPLQVIGKTKEVDLPETVLVGVFVSAHDTAALETAEIRNVRIDFPGRPRVAQNENSHGSSRLEIMNVADGNRKVIFQSPQLLEAPNWMPDGKKLLFNQGGSLFSIPITGGAPEKLNTGEADRNNNDHGISFDGKWLAISHHRQGFPGGGSAIYVLPLQGGTPRLITEKTPSYWHGWAPNGKEVVYVAQRESPYYDIYKKNISGGPEIRLTNSAGTHVDGPEFTPDGKYIYYNGNESGTMQIWRMRPDGTAREQITFDEYNNWFPHISPDGKWIVFLSYLPTIPVDAHPANQRVMLRIMPASGGAPRVLAHLYGGQGTINVPSWSPDSRNVAFVSYSGVAGR